MTVDLHCHTKLSDGSLGIDDIILLAQKRGVEALAITDRDCLAGNVRAKLIGERQGIKIIPGVEISSYDSENRAEVFILGYLCDSPDRLEGLCHRNLAARKRAAQYMMIKAAQKYPITPDLVLKCAQGSTNIYPVHIMAALVESGITTELYGDLYRDLFVNGGEKNILIRPKLSEPEEIVEAIHDAGGIAILAYAGNYKNTTVLEKLMNAGIDGIEVWCPQHDEDTVAELAAFAKKNRLLAIGGSDFRGRNNRHCVSLGSFTTPENNFSELNNYKAKMRRQQKKLANEEK